MSKADAVSDICARLKEIGPELPLRAFSCGPDAGFDKKAHDFALTADFDSAEDFTMYANYPKRICRRDLKPRIASELTRA